MLFQTEPSEHYAIESVVSNLQKPSEMIAGGAQFLEAPAIVGHHDILQGRVLGAAPKQNPKIAVGSDKI